MLIKHHCESDILFTCKKAWESILFYICIHTMFFSSQRGLQCVLQKCITIVQVPTNITVSAVIIMHVPDCEQTQTLALCMGDHPIYLLSL